MRESVRGSGLISADCATHLPKSSRPFVVVGVVMMTVSPGTVRYGTVGLIVRSEYGVQAAVRSTYHIHVVYTDLFSS